MKQNFKILKLFSALLIILSVFIIPTFAEDPPDTGDAGEQEVIVGEMEMMDLEDLLGEDAEPQTSQVDLQTYVPAAVTLDIGENGSIKHNKKTYSKNATFETMTLIFYIIPNSGYEIESVYWNGKDVTGLVSGGLLKIKDLEDGILKVRFKLIGGKQPENDKEKEKQSQKKQIHHIKTSDETNTKPLIYVLAATICVIIFTLTFIKKKEMHYLRKK